MFFNNSSGRSVAALASFIAITISDGLTKEEIDVLSGLFSTIGSNLALISIIETGNLPIEKNETITVSRNSADDGQTSGREQNDAATSGNQTQNGQQTDQAGKNANEKDGPGAQPNKY